MRTQPFSTRLLRFWRFFVIVKFGTPGDWLWRTTTHEGYVITHWLALGRVRKAHGVDVFRPWKLYAGPLCLIWAWIGREEGARRVEAARNACAGI